MDDSSAAPRPRPIEEVLPSAELLAHYKGRIDQFEAERDELLAAVDRCAVHRDEVHRLEWENRKRADEVKELQKALSDAQQFLFEERQRLLLLQAENDELKLQEIQDRQRIQQLLAMTQPLEQTVTYRQGGAPSSVTAYPKGSAGAGAGAASSSAAAAAGAGRTSSPTKASGRPGLHGQQQQHGSGGGERVLRTVFLPTVDSDFLLLKIESLQAQLNEQKQLHEERVAALLADRQLRAQEEERQRSNLMVQVEALSRQVKQLEEALQTTTRDYITARRDRQEAQDAAAAAQAQMVSEVSAARSQLAAVRRQARSDTEKAAAAAESKTREYVDKFREQVRAREEELINLTSLHTATKAAADKRIDALETRVTKLLEANRQLELRRQLDVDGWTADVTSLRKTLAAVDRKLLQMRLIDRLEDDERLDALLDQLEKRTPSIHQQQHHETAQQAHPKKASAAAAGPGGARQQRSSSGGRRSTAAPGGSRRPAVRAAAAGVTAAGGGRRAAAGVGSHQQQLRPARQSDQRRQSQQQQQQQQQRELAEEEDQVEVLAQEEEGEEVVLDTGDDSQYSSMYDDAVAAALLGEDSGNHSSTVSEAPSSIKSTLAAELAAVRRQLADLETLAGQKAARALAGLPRGAAPRYDADL